MDDDVDTDEEIYNNAQNAIRNDFKEAQADYKRHKFNAKLFINNCEIRQRVNRPDSYDRNGKYREPEKSHKSLVDEEPNSLDIPFDELF